MLAKHATASLLLIFGTNVVAASSVVPTPVIGEQSLIVKVQKAGAASPAAGAGGQKGGVATRPPKGGRIGPAEITKGDEVMLRQGFVAAPILELSLSEYAIRADNPQTLELLS